MSDRSWLRDSSVLIEWLGTGSVRVDLLGTSSVLNDWLRSSSVLVDWLRTWPAHNSSVATCQRTSAYSYQEDGSGLAFNAAVAPAEIKVGGSMKTDMSQAGLCRAGLSASEALAARSAAERPGGKPRTRGGAIRPHGPPRKAAGASGSCS